MNKILKVAHINLLKHLKKNIGMKSGHLNRHLQELMRLCLQEYQEDMLFMMEIQ